MQIPDVANKLTSEGAIITVVFLGVGLYVLTKLPSIVAGVVAALRSGGNGAEKERANQILTALLASTAAKESMRAVLEADIREHEGVRRHHHQMRGYLSVFNLLGLKLIEHLERVSGRALLEERELLSKAARAATEEPPPPGKEAP